MDNILSTRARTIQPSINLVISAKAKAMRDSGIDVLDFSVGEPDVDTPETIRQADCAFPSATQNVINTEDAQNLVNNGVYVVSEDANMPTVPEGIDLFIENKLMYSPGEAANTGGMSVSAGR